jgi:hypothetical protein
MTPEEFALYRARRNRLTLLICGLMAVALVVGIIAT